MKKHCTVNGVDICYDECGPENGIPVMLIHGLTSSKESMYCLRNVLQDTYRVYSIDTRGHGESQRIENYTLEDHGHDMVAFAQTVCPAKPVIIGLSMGSYIALRAMEVNPDAFLKGVLIGTKGKGSESSVNRILREMGLDKEKMSDFRIKMFGMKLAFAPGSGIMPKIRAARYRGVALTPEEKASEERSLKDFDNLERASQVTCPVMVVSGEYDKINPPELGKEVADAIPGAQYVLFKNGSHMMIAEKPKEFAKLLEEFIAR